ncbi:receptor like protein kinase S.2 [Telopea speciosissima]|uniref:receptor like protein kinase S.2 n=1 Tax=Telopea speciosissima TaxID=54955 RepID=UPI001CC42185|nr:receptor like protein kinase S.2 [Telopea speciosissima]
MQLKHFLPILPSDDLDEIEPSIPLRSKSCRKSSTDQEHGLLTMVSAMFHGIYDWGWTSFADCYVTRNTHSSCNFQDTAGVDLTQKVVGTNNPRIFSFAELYIATNGFSDDQILGSGGFGRVYRAVLPSDGTIVAVKCLSEKGEQFEKTFAAELMAVAQLRHRNLVRLRGWCVHEDQLLLVYDYMPNLSLDRILFKRPDCPAMPTLNWERRWRIAAGLAAALFYLHEQLETQIIHRDVKTSNVMLDSNYNARLGDFGLARWLEHELEDVAPSFSSNYEFRMAETTRIGGTIGYLPPESFQKKSVATVKSDVFSFGIVVLEVVSGRRAIDLACQDDQIVLLDWVRRLSDEGKCLQAADTRLSDGSYKLSEMELLINLGLLCSLGDPQVRPNMKWVVEVLAGNIVGKLPALPSFKSYPQYISYSSSAATTIITISTMATTTTTNASQWSSSTSGYATAGGDTIFMTAMDGESEQSGESGVSGVSNSNGPRRSNIPSVDTPREIPFKEIIAATKDFSDTRRVAELDFGTAYHGYLENRQHVLVKRLGMKKCPALRVRFSNELQNLGNLRHRNLVQLRGWCTEQGEMLVVYDYSARNQLNNFLFHDKSFPSVLTWRIRYNIIKSIASAIFYLHEGWDEQVIHRNITSSAIILDGDMNPRLGCFALAEFLARNDHGHHAAAAANPERSVRGIFGYIAPEYIESGEVTTLADIYSFGVLMLEVVTGRMAVDFRWPEVLLLKKVRDFEIQRRPLVELVDWRLNDEYDNRELIRLVKLGIACTRSDPSLRPSMRQIISILDGNDGCFKEEARRKEMREEWLRRNDYSLTSIRRIQAIGIQ